MGLEHLTLHGAPLTSSSAGSFISSLPEVIICSTLFLCRCDVLNDDLVSAVNRLDGLKQHLGVYLDGITLSAFASKLLLWLCYLHVRLSIFFMPTANNGSATTLLDSLLAHPDHQQILTRSYMYLSEIFGGSYPAIEISQDAAKVPVSVRMHETFTLISNILRYRAWRYQLKKQGGLSQHNELVVARTTAINLDIRRMEAEFALASATNTSAAVLHLKSSAFSSAVPASIICYHEDTFPGHSPTSISAIWEPLGLNTCRVNPLASPSSDQPFATIDRTSLHWLSCYAAFSTAKILWSRILRPTIRNDESSAAAVRSILQIALRLQEKKNSSFAMNNMSYKKVIRSMLWPLPLFVAGIETTDDIHADWIKTFIDQVALFNHHIDSPASGGCGHSSREMLRAGHGGGRMSGGIDGKRVQLLMARAREMQDRLGRRVDVEDFMRELGGD